MYNRNVCFSSKGVISMISKLSLDQMNALSISELELLRYLDGHKLEIQDLSIQKLAQMRFVSTATIMRLCKKIGFKGYSELKFYLKEEAQNQIQVNQNPTIQDVIKMNLRSIEETASHLDDHMLEKIVDVMLASKTIHFFGKGITSTILSYISKLLLTRGVINGYYEDTHIAYIAAEQMSEDDVVFICSLSGSTHQTIRMGQIAKSRGAKVITITTTTQNELSKIADYAISFHSEGDLIKPDDIVSREPILFILNTIVTLYFNKKKT
jgi:DNA-binding MurR/RpiR family transcriptional regulator